MKLLRVALFQALILFFSGSVLLLALFRLPGAQDLRALAAAGTLLTGFGGAFRAGELLAPRWRRAAAAAAGSGLLLIALLLLSAAPQLFSGGLLLRAALTMTMAALPGALLGSGWATAGKTRRGGENAPNR